MSINFSGSIKAVVQGTFRNALDLGDVIDSLSQTNTETLTDGTGVNKAQIQWHDQRTLTTGADEDLDLSALVTAFGAAAFTKVKAVFIRIVPPATGYTLKLAGGDTNPLTAWFSDPSDELVIGGMLLLTHPTDGYTVDGTHKTIKLTNPTGGSITYDIIIIGEGALS